MGCLPAALNNAFVPTSKDLCSASSEMIRDGARIITQRGGLGESTEGERYTLCT